MDSLIVLILILIDIIIIFTLLVYNFYKNEIIFEMEIRIVELEADNEKLKLKCVGLTDNRYCVNCNIMCNNKIRKDNYNNGKSNWKN